jgi:hypothetical protein
MSNVHRPGQGLRRITNAAGSLVSSILFFTAVIAVAISAVFATGVIAGPLLARLPAPPAIESTIQTQPHRPAPDRWDVERDADWDR